MQHSKISQPLSDHLNQVAAHASVEIILELSASDQPTINELPRHEKISLLKGAFEQKSVPVEQLIERHGGKVIDRAWINNTLRVQIPAYCLDQLSDLESVSILDIPRLLSLD